MLINDNFARGMGSVFRRGSRQQSAREGDSIVYAKVFFHCSLRKR